MSALKLAKHTSIFVARMWYLFMILGVAAYGYATWTPTPAKIDNRQDCGNAATKAFIVGYAKERNNAHNLSDAQVAHILCK